MSIEWRHRVSIRSCPIQDICCHFATGDNKPHNHDVRDKFICTRFLDGSCELTVEIQTWAMGLTLSCKIKGKK